MDVAALVISIAAIFISIMVAFIQDEREHKLNRTNLEAIYFNEIYKEYLTKRLPNARKYIHIDPNGVLKDTDKIRDELNNIRQDSLYYLYNDEDFYNKLKLKSQSLEDYLIRSSVNPLLGEEQTEFYSKLQNELKELYKTINNKFLGIK
ncbi:hypothetical protein QVE09_25070 [Paenibacillus sp. ClWae2A]|uniref:hypothetical protein n=1 Tax=Paenibacillus sp. ClWae2A TaxID=3057177 RepID=UPI0028F568F2|nr:hypothetical protein [Paenibacillus sp. ClWae2A]MDT9722185.1 hypothetical protein [Paenibacillus sp. ClWae2A]